MKNNFAHGVYFLLVDLLLFRLKNIHVHIFVQSYPTIRKVFLLFWFFHLQIEEVITSTLKELGVEKVNVLCEDKGALDYTIRARLITALSRMEKI